MCILLRKFLRRQRLSQSSNVKYSRKILYVALLINCPPWPADIEPNREHEFLNLLEQVHDSVHAAAKAVLIQDDLRGWHKTLFQPFVPRDYYAGRFRQINSALPCLDYPVHVGGIAGTPSGKVVEEMNTLFVDLKSNIDNLEQRWAQAKPPERAGLLSKTLAWFVGSYIRIHPFINGNGRTSRLLWRWGLTRFGSKPQVCTHPRPDTPYDDVMKHAMRGDDKPLRKFILQFLRDSK